LFVVRIVETIGAAAAAIITGKELIGGEREIQDGKIYSHKQVARILGISRKRVIELIENGGIRARKIIDGSQTRYLILGKSLIDYMESGEN
jgi:excisionase family DNA binding protein